MSDLAELAADMAQRGVTHIFGIPGSGSSLTLLDALEKLGVSFCLTHFEGAGALMAGAMARLSGRAGAAICIKGPGLSNMVPGLAACRLDALPVVSLSEAYPPGTPVFKSHKRMEHDALVLAVTKGRRFISRNGPGFSSLADWAEAEVPGPVHLDIAESGIQDDAHIPFQKSNEESETSREGLFDLLTAARRPVIIAGTFSLRRQLSSHLNRLSIPVFSVAAAKGVVDETLPHAAGVYTGVGLELTPEFSILPQADLVVGIGLRHNEVLDVRTFKCRSINFDPVKEELCSGFHFDHVFDGSSEELKTLFTILDSRSWGLTSLGKISEKMRKRMLDGPFMPANAFQVIERHFDHRVRIVLDTGNFCTIGEHIWRVTKPERYLAAGQGRYMGVGLPMALGAAIHDPGVPTVAVLGDGGIGMFIAEIKIAVRHKLPLIVVLMSDGYFGSIRARSLKDGLTEGPVTIQESSWMKVIEAFGVGAVKVKTEDEIEDALCSWHLTDGPLFIEIPFDPERYQLMVSDIR